MKKVTLAIVFFMIISFTVFSQSEEKPTRKLGDLSGLKKAYAYVDEMLMISKGDLNCTYFITDTMGEDLKITSCYNVDNFRAVFSDQDLMLINKGEAVGIKEGDQFLVLGKGKEMSNEITHNRIGTYYLMKSMARVTTVYEDKAMIILENGCHPVYLGDILIPYKEKETVFRLKPDFSHLQVPDTEVKGQIISMPGYIDNNKYDTTKRIMTGNSNFITIDLGIDEVSFGNILVLYKEIDDLPPIITGYGIVLNPRENNSTVKLIEVYADILMGDKVALLEEPEIPGYTPTEKSEALPPLIKKIAEQKAELKKNNNMVEVNILFGMNEKAIDAAYTPRFERIRKFIESKNDYYVILKGYSCSVGGLEHNLKLSKERVDNIKAYLVNELKIREDLIKTHFYGEKSPAFDNSSEAQRRKNRRVNIQVIGK